MVSSYHLPLAKLRSMIERILNLRITGIVQETAEAASFLLEDITRKRIVYKPGQFLTLIFNHGLHEVRRSYSISSPPGYDR